MKRQRHIKFPRILNFNFLFALKSLISFVHTPLNAMIDIPSKKILISRCLLRRGFIFKKSKFFFRFTWDKIFIFPTQFPSPSTNSFPMQRDKVRYVCVDSRKWEMPSSQALLHCFLAWLGKKGAVNLIFFSTHTSALVFGFIQCFMIFLFLCFF